MLQRQTGVHTLHFQSIYLPEESCQHGWTSSNKASHQRILLDLLTPQQTAALQNIEDEPEHGIAAQDLHDIMVCDRLSSTQSSWFLMSLIYLHICTGGHLLQIHPFCGTELVPCSLHAEEMRFPPFQIQDFPTGDNPSNGKI